MPNMNRRTFVTTVATFLATSASVMLLREATATAQETAHDLMREPHGPSHQSDHHTAREAITMEGHPMGEEMTNCIQLCRDCHTLCVQMIGHCLKLGGRYAAPEHIRLLMDCAEMCATSADFMARESSLHDRLCSLCAELCQRCAESCQHIAGDDPLMRRCVELCRRCAESCERMSSKRAA